MLFKNRLVELPFGRVYNGELVVLSPEVIHLLFVEGQVWDIFGIVIFSAKKR
ncbi:hypothetical protein D3C77_650890 [compost metagenome]